MQHTINRQHALVLFVIAVSLIAATGLRAESERPTDLPPFLKGVTLTASAPAGAEATAIGSVDAMVGDVVVVNRQTQHGHWATVGDRLYGEDIVVTLADARCRLTLTGKNVVAVGGDSIVVLAEHLADRSAGRKVSRLEVLKGKALFFVYRLFGFEEIDFQVTTPKMVAAVRGTKFGVNVRHQDDKLGRNLTDLALAPDWRAKLDAAGLDARIHNGLIEIAHCEEGRVEVNGQMVAAGTAYDRSSDRVGPLGAAYVHAFNEATGTQPASSVSSAEDGQRLGAVSTNDTAVNSVQKIADTTEAETADTSTAATGSSGGDSGTTAAADTAAGGTPPAGAEPDTTPGDPGVQNDPVEPVSDPEPEAEQEPEPEPGPEPEPTTLASAHGYYAAMITDNDDSTLQHTLITMDRVDFDTKMNEATGLINDTLWMQLDGTGDRLNPYVQRFKLPIGNANLGTSVTINLQQMGGNDHLQWGYWTMAAPLEIDDDEIAIDNKAYYIFGDPTPEASLQGMTGTAAYTGEAAGTFWTASGGTDMTGSFVCDVDFDSGQVDGFNMSVSGGGHSASISGAGGSLNAGEFELGGGQWQLDGQDPHGQHARGSLYGTQADQMGGAWQMRKHGEAASGVFAGARQ